MARRRREASDDVSLFPFMSILASIIGVLTLLIASMALAQMDNSIVARAEQYEKLRKQLDARSLEVESLQQQVSKGAGNASEKQKEIANKRKQLEKLQNQLDKIRQQNDQQIEIVEVSQSDPIAQRQDVDQVQKELESLQEHVAQLEKDLEDRKKPPKESAVTILPSGSGKGFDPVFVECAAGSVVLHSIEPPLRIRQKDMAADAVFAELFNQISSSENQTMVFLVRNDGLSTYRSVRKLAIDREVRHGKLPVVGGGRIDLSHFREKK